MRIEHQEEYRDRIGIMRVVYFIDREPLDTGMIVELVKVVDEDHFTVRSNTSLTSATHAKRFDNHQYALKEYYKRIYDFLDYKFPTPIKMPD